MSRCQHIPATVYDVVFIEGTKYVRRFTTCIRCWAPYSAAVAEAQARICHSKSA